MKKINEKFKEKSSKKRDWYGRDNFSKMANRGMMKRWGKNKNMGRGKT